MSGADDLLLRDATRRLAEAEATIAALLAGQIDAVIDPESHTPVLLAKAQRAIREERDRAQRYLDTPGVLIVALDLEGRITVANRHACTVLGWSRAELLGQDWIRTCLPERDQARAAMRRDRLLRSQTRLQARARKAGARRLDDPIEDEISISEITIIARSGKECLIEWRCTPLRDDRGGVVGTFSAGMDISQRKQAEAALQQTTDRLVERTRSLEEQAVVLGDQAALLDLAQDAIVVRDMDDRIRFWSQGAEAMYGWTKEEAQGRRKKELLQTEFALAADQINVTLLNDGRWAGEATQRKRDGTWITVATRSTLQRAPDGRPLRMLTIDNDITDRQSADAERRRLTDELSRNVDALRVTEDRMNYALGAAKMGVWAIDIGSARVEWSKTVAPMFGLLPEQAPETVSGFLALVHPDDRHVVEEKIGLSTRNGTEFNTEFRILWPDSSLHWMSGQGRAETIAEDGSKRLVGIGVDITQRKALEAQLRQAQKMEAVGELAGGVAHDFNNLLSVMLGYADFVMKSFGPQDERQADMAEIVKAGDRAAALIRQLLVFSRQQVLHPVNLNLSDLVAGILPMLTRVIGEHLDLIPILEPGICPVRADPGQVEQVIMNLVVNARDAMPSGGRLTVATGMVELDEAAGRRHQVPPGGYAMLTVSDTGTGMSEAIRSRLFEPFFTTKPPGEGTGLGLAMVYGIIKQSGGFVSVSSEIGVGTTFTAYLPRVEGRVEIAPVFPSVETLAPGSETVLVVEDEEAVRRLTRKILEGAGYTVFDAAGPGAAEDIFDESADLIDLLVTDVIMPGTSGPELFQRLLRRRPDLRVLYVSGYIDDAVLHGGRLGPGDEFLQKPFTASALRHRVREALDQPDSEAPLPHRGRVEKSPASR